MPTSQWSEMFPIRKMHGQFGFKCAGDRDAFGSTGVGYNEDALVFLSLVQLMNGSERRHTHVANAKE